MNRDERKKVKTEGNQEHAAPHADGADKYERHIDGSILVRGGIETNFPPNLIEKHDRERKEDAAQEHNKFVVEIITLVFVIIVAGLTGLQDYFTGQQVKLSRKEIVVSQQGSRPFVGVDGFGLKTACKAEDGSIEECKTLTKPPDFLGGMFAFSSKNYGPLPAANYHAKMWPFIDGKEITTATQFTVQKHTIFPGEVYFHRTLIPSPFYEAIVGGYSTFSVRIQVQYDYAEGHSDECGEYTYLHATRDFSYTKDCK